MAFDRHGMRRWVPVKALLACSGWTIRIVVACILWIVALRMAIRYECSAEGKDYWRDRILGCYDDTITALASELQQGGLPETARQEKECRLDGLQAGRGRMLIEYPCGFPTRIRGYTVFALVAGAGMAVVTYRGGCKASKGRPGPFDRAGRQVRVHHAGAKE